MEIVPVVGIIKNVLVDSVFPRVIKVVSQREIVNLIKIVSEESV